MHPLLQRSAALRVAFVFALVAAALLWSDVGPDLANWLYELAAGSATRFEAELGADIVRRTDVPRPWLDTIGHLALWFLGTSVVMWSARRVANPVWIAIACAAVSLASEWLQPMVSVGRVGEWSDAAANVGGVLLALILVGPSAALRRERRGHPHAAH